MLSPEYRMSSPEGESNARLFLERGTKNVIVICFAAKFTVREKRRCVANEEVCIVSGMLTSWCENYVNITRGGGRGKRKEGKIIFSARI